MTMMTVHSLLRYKRFWGSEILNATFTESQSRRFKYTMKAAKYPTACRCRTLLNIVCCTSLVRDVKDSVFQHFQNLVTSEDDWRKLISFLELSLMDTNFVLAEIGSG